MSLPDKDSATALTAFKFDQTDVQAFDLNGVACILAKGVCDALGLGNVSQALANLDDDEKGVTTADTPGGAQSVSYVTESGLYSLVLRSRKPEAKAFKRWVTHEVLPAIRSHGGYLTPAKIEEALTDPDTIIRLATSLKEERAARLELETQVKVTTPKAEAFDAFLSTKGDYSVNEAAKILSRHHDILTGETRLRNWMQANRWIYRSAGKPRAYQTRLDQGRLVEKAQWHYHPETGEKIIDPPQVRVTAKGIEALAKALLKVEVAS